MTQTASYFSKSDLLDIVTLMDALQLVSSSTQIKIGSVPVRDNMGDRLGTLVKPRAYGSRWEFRAAQ